MHRNPLKQDIEVPDGIDQAAFAKMAAFSHRIALVKHQSRIAELEAQALRYEMAINNVSQGVCIFDGEERLVLCNRRYSEIYSLQPSEVGPGTTLSEIAERRFAVGTCSMAAADDLMWCNEVNSDTFARTWNSELKDGRTIHICHQPMPDGGWVSTHEDITELKAKRAAANEIISLQALIDCMPDYLWVKDLNSRFLVINKALASDLGRTNPSEMIGLSDFDLHAFELAQDFRSTELNILQSEQPMIDRQEVLINAAGTEKWLSSTKVPLRNEQNEIFGLACVSRDITERKRAEDRIQFMANHDALTGLPNRTLLKDRLSQAVLYAQRYDGWVTVVFIDLDNFKTVNDSLGHNAGDELLKAVARRMTSCVRSTDTVVRLGGDEFVILLLDQPKNADIISETLQKIRMAIAESVHLEGHDLKVTSSIGIANYPNDGMDADTLLANADAAMYRAKEIGRDNFQFYTPEMNTKVHEKFMLQEELRKAVARSEFVLLYQPQVDLRTGRVFAVEALIRWMHPTQGMVAPIKFIPVAEDTGLIVPIGDWVLHEACRQNKAWQDVGLMHMNVCVNVSARQFREKNLISRVANALQESGLDAKYLELEITESLIMENVEQAVATMEELEKLGVQISIDDFGTGYSSLSVLKTFPVARLKIDKSFISSLPGNDSDKAVASAVISLGQKLNLRVIAEGVETAEQVAFLRDNNCDEMQGYHFSKPIFAQEIETLLRSVRPTIEITIP
jgi:diguanylate cyclase (GGDEF)-like protein/PAS domain S-box-containing protein